MISHSQAYYCMNRHCPGCTVGALPPFPAGWGGGTCPGAPPPVPQYAYATTNLATECAEKLLY